MPRGRSQHANTELLPLSPLLLQILVTLADGERHGYAILREIRSRTNAALDPGAGSLYGAIQKLLTEGAIEECSERPHPHLMTSGGAITASPILAAALPPKKSNACVKSSVLRTRSSRRRA